MNSFKKSYERIKLHLGFNYDAATLDALNDEELLERIEKAADWDIDLMREACYRAGMIEEWEDTEDNFEEVYYRAEEFLQKRIEEEKEREVEI